MSDRSGIRILFATDGSKGAAVALDVLTAMPLRPVDEVVVVSYPAFFLAARPAGSGIVSRLMGRRHQAALDQVEAARRRAAATGVRTIGVVQGGEDAVGAILRVAVDRNVDLIVVGSRGLGPLSSMVVGSTARALAILSPVPVLVVRDRRAVPTRVLIAVDGSPASRAAIGAVTRLPLPADTTIELLHVLPVHDWSDVAAGEDGELADLRDSFERDEAAHARALLHESTALLPTGRAVHTTVERGDVSQTILARASARGADLIVLGSRGMSGPRRPLWGSTAERVMVSARCPVLIAPAPADASAHETAKASSARAGIASA